MQSPIRKAVIPVAGLGTRFLPATKSIPKELVTIVDRPIIDHVVAEAREAGIEQFVFVTGRNKGAIEDHFDRAFELETVLQRRSKTTALAELQSTLLPAGAAMFVRQQEPLGLGHAVWCARHVIGNEPFAVLLPDVVIKSPQASGLAQLVEAYHQLGGNQIAVEEVPWQSVGSYGIVDIGPFPDLRRSDWQIRGMVEKPKPSEAPSNLSVVGRYVLSPRIFDLLERQSPGAGNEVQLTDAMAALLAEQPFHAVKVEGRSFDCGSRLGFLTANIALALADPVLRRELAGPLLELVAEAGLPSIARQEQRRDPSIITLAA